MAFVDRLGVYSQIAEALGGDHVVEAVLALAVDVHFG